MRVAIIGGGFTGAATAIHLLRQLKHRNELTVYEPETRLGRGIAYAPSPDHFLLNVAAHNLAFSSDGDGQFLEWALANHTNAENFREKDGAYYFPRSWFGRYVEDMLAQEIAANAGRVRFIHRRAVAQKISLSGKKVEITSRGETAEFDHAILAIGNAPSRPIAVDAMAIHCPKVVQSAWALPETEIDPDARVIIVGSGLTMADVVGELEARGHRSIITCISRSGRRHHCASGTVEEFVPPWPLTMTSASGLTRQVRGWVDHSIHVFGDWRPVIDYLRRNSAAVWRLLDKSNQRRLRRHLRPFWDIHRYQMPPAAHRRIVRLMHENRLFHIRAGALRVERGGLRIVSSEGERLIPADVVINATGFDPTYSTAVTPLEDLLSNPRIDLKAARSRGMGVDDGGALLELGEDRRLLAIGYLARDNHGELNTVNAIGATAELLATVLSDTICQSGHSSLLKGQPS